MGRCHQDYEHLETLTHFWAGFVGIVMIGCSLTKHRTDRLFFYLTAAINVTASIAYYTMGSNLGFTPIAVEFRRSDSHVSGLQREIFWVRYVDW